MHALEADKEVCSTTTSLQLPALRLSTVNFDVLNNSFFSFSVTGANPGKFTTAPLSRKAQKFAQVVAAAKATSAAKARFHGQSGKATRLNPLTKEYKAGPLVKEYKGRRAAKKYNPKKHAWKKSAHKEKQLRTRQLKRDLKEKNVQQHAKKDKTMTKEFAMAKELLRKEKAMKKRERREKRAKVMGNRKNE